MTEKDELLQAKERELAETQQQLRQQVSCPSIIITVTTVLQTQKI